MLAEKLEEQQLGKSSERHGKTMRIAWKMLGEWLENGENDQMIKRCGIEIWCQEHSQHQVSLSTNTGKACSALRKIIEYQEAEKERRLGEQAKFERDEFERIIEAGIGSWISS